MEEQDTILDPDGDLLIILRRSSDDLAQSQHEAAGSSKARSKAPNAEDNSDKTVALPECRFKASSKHLALVCPHFKAMMSGSWLETRIHDDGLYHWVLEDFEEEEMTIILNVIHARTDLVPHTVDLQTLTEIARIVDYLGCHEAMHFSAKHWISLIENQAPGKTSDDGLCWVCVAGVFRDEVLFQLSTHHVIFSHIGPIGTLGLPILPLILDELNRQRTECLRDIFGALYDLISQLSTGIKCNPKCDSSLLGGICKSILGSSLNISSRPRRPYKTWSILKAHEKIQSIADTISAYEGPENYLKWRDQEQIWNHCGLDDLINTISDYETQVEGVDLSILPSQEIISSLRRKEIHARVLSESQVHNHRIR